MITILFATALFAAPFDDGAAQERCTVIRYAPDGRRTEHFGHPADFGVDVQIHRGPGHSDISAGVSAGTNGSSSSSVSVSSSTRGGARSSTSASHQDGDRTVTTFNDDAGCTVVIDDRPADRRIP